MNFQAFPKIELHLHLDCSLPYSFVQKYRPELSRIEYEEAFVAPGKCTDLADYLTRSDESIALMQTGEQLRLSTRSLFDRIRKDNIIYAEIRFAPLEHTRNGLSSEDVVQIVVNQLKQNSRETGIRAGLILCTLRHYSKEQSLETVKLAEKFLGDGVCGFDIAADEAGFSLAPHTPAFEYANQAGIPCTAHAGEALGAESVNETLDLLKPQRIGHGVRSMEDSAVINRILDNGIHLEICPTSNIQTNVFDRIEDHNLNQIYEAGISMSINTDSRTITPVTLTSEYELLHNVFGWTKNHFVTCNLNAINAAFTDDEIKKELRESFLSGNK
jgi:adenosine deaminase